MWFRRRPAICWVISSCGRAQFPPDDRFQQAMVNHIAILTGWERSVRHKPQDQDRNASGRCLDFAKDWKRRMRCQGNRRAAHPVRDAVYRSLPASAPLRHRQTMRFQQRGQRVGIRGIEARMYTL